MLLDWLSQLVVSAFLLWGIGGVVLLLLKPQHYQRDILLVAPYFGLAAISAISHYLGVAGLSVHQFVWLFVVLIVSAPLLWLFRKRPRLNIRLHWRIIVIAAAAYVLASIPMLRLGYLTTIGTTIDGLSYAVRSEYLQEAALAAPDMFPGQPFYGWVASQINTLRVGDVYYIGVLGLLTGQRSYQLLTTTAILFHALSSVSIYLFSRRTLHFKSTTALIASCLIAVHNLLLWAVYDNFLSQTIAMSFFPLVLGFGVNAVRTMCLRETVGFALLLSALFSLYPVYAVLAVLTCGLCSLIVFMQEIIPLRVNWRWIVRKYLHWGGSLLLLLLFSNGVAVYRSLTELTFVGQLMDPEASGAVGPGNILVFPPLAEVWGGIIHASVAYGLNAWQLPRSLLTGASALVILLASWGWWQVPKRQRAVALIFIFMPALLSVQQRFGVNPPHGYAYGYFKTISLVALLSVPFVVQGIVGLFSHRYLRYGAVVCLCALFILNSFNTIWTMSYILNDRIAVDANLIDVLTGVHAVPADKWILLDLQPSIKQHWLGYMLKGHLIHYREPLFTQNVGDPTAPSTYEYELVERAIDTQRRGQVIDEPWYNPDLYRVLWGNTTYELRQRTDSTLLEAQMSDDAKPWRSKETLEVVLGEAGEILSLKTPTDVLLSGKLAGRPQSLLVTILVPDVGAEVCLISDCFNLQPGVWTLDLNISDADSFVLLNTGHVDLIVYGMKAFEDVRGDPKLFLEVAQRRDGVAFVTQSVGDVDLTYQVTFIPPSGNTSAYRLGLHLFDAQQGTYFGVWGLDFPPGISLIQGYMHLNLQTRIAEGEVNGVAVPVDLGSFDIEMGNIEVQAVWWKLDTPSYLALYRSAVFMRDADARIEFEQYRDIPPTILVAP